MTTTSRWLIKTDSNEVSPTGFLGKIDGPTILRKCGDLLHRGAQGACAANLNLAYSPVAAQATINTTTGSETANDTITPCGTVITLKSSGATGNQANIAAGTAGTSTGAASGATTASGLQMYVNINGDGAQLIPIDDGGTHTGAHIASVIQTKIRALTPNNPLNAVAFTSATCAFTSTHYVITSGAVGSGSSVVVTSAALNDAAAPLKMGVNNGGTEAVGTASTLDNIAALINNSVKAWNGICTAFVCGQNMTLTAFLPGLMGNGLALAVSSTGSTMTITHAWGASVAGTEGTNAIFSMGL
ncbi:MAG: hypothetical protein KGL39_20055 [Patescibacteria group bacterium]|nr:hypothetical protein [Patescibacteria group bacterium]